MILGENIRAFLGLHKLTHRLTFGIFLYYDIIEIWCEASVKASVEPLHRFSNASLELLPSYLDLQVGQKKPM